MAEKNKDLLPMIFIDGMETRLSWIAALLPYFGHADWHRQLDFGSAWNSPQNRPLSQRPLPEAINPVLGLARSDAGFPVTHYVGVSGVGPDAGRLKADDPRAGVFAYGRTTRTEDLTRGASNTIAVLGVTEQCGPWASGGEASVRSLQRRPYVNGPDGFGSGQPGGMLAGMADGSVRFISKDVDPGVIEQLATIHGPGGATAADLEPKPVERKPEAQGAEEPQEPAGKPAGPGESKVKPAAGQTPPPLAATPIDLQARLADKIFKIEWTDMPLGDAIDLLSAMSTLPITVDPDALLAAGVSPGDRVSVHLADATVGQILDKLLSSRKLSFIAEAGRVLVTMPAEYRETLRPVNYTVSDLTGDDAKATAELAGLIEKFVAPDSWRPNGGRGSIQLDGRALAIVQSGAVHDQIVAFCEKLRTARDQPTRSRGDGERFALTTRCARAKAMLGRDVSANFTPPAPLAKVLRYLKKQAGVEILVDRSALRAAGVADDREVSLSVSKQPLSAALAKVLDPLKLTYRLVDARTIQVTSQKALAARLELEFYSLGEAAARGQGAATLVERIKSRVAPPTWSDAGGPGMIHFDPASRCLIVLQSQPAQIELEALLAERAN